MLDFKLLRLTTKLPTGLRDAQTVHKLNREYDEVVECLIAGDMAGALLEAADCYYYWQKSLANLRLPWRTWRMVKRKAPFTMGQIRAAAVAKYSLRARPGNPKNDAEERTAVGGLL